MPVHGGQTDPERKWPWLHSWHCESDAFVQVSSMQPGMDVQSRQRSAAPDSSSQLPPAQAEHWESPAVVQVSAAWHPATSVQDGQVSAAAGRPDASR
jgi:hypothetical protein